MKHLVEVVVLVDVHADTKRDLQEAMKELKREAPFAWQSTASSDGFTFTLRSRRRAKSVHEVKR